MFSFMTIPIDAMTEYQAAVTYYRNPNTPTLRLQLAGATARLAADFSISPEVAQAIGADFALAVEALGGGSGAPGEAMAQVTDGLASKGIKLPPFIGGILGTVLADAEEALAAKTAGKF